MAGLRRWFGHGRRDAGPTVEVTWPEWPEIAIGAMAGEMAAA